MFLEKCSSAESENSLHGREDFNQQAVAKQTAWALLIHSPCYKVRLGLLHRPQRSWLQNWFLRRVTLPELQDITKKVGKGTILLSSGKSVHSYLISQTTLLLICFVAYIKRSHCLVLH